MSMVGFPLLLIPLAIYNIIVLLMPGVSLAEPLVKLTLMSGAEWPVTLSDMLLTLGIVLLLLEVIKAARPGAKYLTEHFLSLIVFGAATAEFVLWPHFGTSTFFLLTMLTLVEFLAGIAACTARNAGRVNRCGFRTGRPGCRRARTAIRTRACTIGTVGDFGRGIRAARSPPAQNRACRGHAERILAGGPVPGTTAGQRLAVLAGHAAALTFSLK